MTAKKKPAARKKKPAARKKPLVMSRDERVDRHYDPKHQDRRQMHTHGYPKAGKSAVLEQGTVLKLVPVNISKAKMKEVEAGKVRDPRLKGRKSRRIRQNKWVAA